MSKFGKLYTAPPKDFVIGAVRFEPVSLELQPQPKYYAFAVSEGSPKVLEFPVDRDGEEGLAALIRTGMVISVVKGLNIDFSVESAVHFLDGDATSTARITIPGFMYGPQNSP